jgi:hypothetical protein
MENLINLFSSFSAVPILDSASCQHLQHRLLDQIEHAVSDFHPGRYESLMRACIFYGIADTALSTLRKQFNQLITTRACHAIYKFLKHLDDNIAKQVKETMFRDHQVSLVNWSFK